MRNVLAVLLAVVMCLGVTGCVCPVDPDDATSTGENAIVAVIEADFEDTSWKAVSIDPKDYGITDDALKSVSLPEFHDYTLGELTAYYLHTDGAGAEGSSEVLYERFMAAPNTVLTYLALIGDQKARGGPSGNDTAADELCRAIALADVVWHDATEEFDQILVKYKSVYPDGRIAGILKRLEDERQAAIGRL